jgi:hypothetical protein
MDKTHGIIASVLVISSLTATATQAAATCNQYAFIYSNTFTLGDGEGMETHQCNEKNLVNGDLAFTKLQEMIQAGQNRQARKQLDTYRNVNVSTEYIKFKPDAEMCVRPAKARAFESLMQQLGKNLAAEHERAGKPQAAIDTDVAYCLYDDAARIHLALAGKKPVYPATVGQAYQFGKAHNNNALMSKLRQIVSSTSNEYLAQEKNFYKSSIYNASLFTQALDLYNKVEDTNASNSLIKQSEARGDELAKQDNCRVLTAARDYYSVSNQNNKIQSVKNKAMKIGDDLEKKGNLKAAADCYNLAEADNKSQKLLQILEKQNVKQQAVIEKQESSRKQKFTREQDDLEKELGL